MCARVRGLLSHWSREQAEEERNKSSEWQRRCSMKCSSHTTNRIACHVRADNVDLHRITLNGEERRWIWPWWRIDESGHLMRNACACYVNVSGWMLIYYIMLNDTFFRAYALHRSWRTVFLVCRPPPEWVGKSVDQMFTNWIDVCAYNQKFQLFVRLIIHFRSARSVLLSCITEILFFCLLNFTYETCLAA